METGGDFGQNAEANAEAGGNASNASVVELRAQSKASETVLETLSKASSYTPRPRKSTSLRFKNTSLPPSPPPKDLNVRISSSVDYIKNLVYSRAVRNKFEPFRPPSESTNYVVELEHDVWPPGRTGTGS